MRKAFFAPPHFCTLPGTNAHFPVTQCRTQSLLHFSSSPHPLPSAPSSCPKVSHRMNVPFSFSRDDDDQMIAGKEFQTIPRHSGRGAATVCGQGVGVLLGCFVVATFETLSYSSLAELHNTKSELEHSLCEKYHLLCRHPLRSVVEVRSSYHSGSFVRRLDALRGLGRRFIIVWGQEKNIWWETWADGRKHWHYD